MFRRNFYRKMSLAVALLMMLNLMIPLLSLAASKIQIFYDSTTGEISGVIYSDQDTVSLSVYSSGVTTDVTGSVYFEEPVVYDSVYATEFSGSIAIGLSPSYFTVTDGVYTTNTNTVTDSVYYEYDATPGYPVLGTNENGSYFSMYSDGLRSATLKWEANTEFDLAGYNVYMDLVNDDIDGQGVKVNNSLITALAYEFLDLPYATEIEFGVTAVDVAGNESLMSYVTYFIPGNFDEIELNLNGMDAGYVVQPGDDLVTFTPTTGTLAIGEVEEVTLSLEFPFVFGEDGIEFSTLDLDKLTYADFELVNTAEPTNVISADELNIYGGLYIDFPTELVAGQEYILRMSASSTGDEITLPNVVTKDGLATFSTIDMNPVDFHYFAVELVEPNDITPPPLTYVLLPAVNDTKVVDKGSLNNGKDGKVAVEIAEGTKTVLLPARAAEMVGKNKLEIEAGKFTVEIPADILKELQQLLSETDQDDAQISFNFNVVSKEETDKLMADASTHSNAVVTTAGDVFEFTLSVITKNGVEKKLSKFATPLTLKLKVNETANPDLLGVYYISDDGDLEYVGGKLVGDYLVVEISHFSKYAALEYDKQFTDVKSNYWAADVIKNMTAKHVVFGVTDTEFGPTQNVTRAEFASFLVNALGLEAKNPVKFTDVAVDAKYAKAVAAANEAGIIAGRSGTLFAPDDTITREEMAVMIVRAYEVQTGQMVIKGSDAKFTDLDQVSAWAVEYVSAANKLGFILGRGDGNFAPQGSATRAESAQVASKLF